MQTIDTLIFPKWLIPIEPFGVYYEDYGIAINGSKIAAIAPANEIKKQYQGKETLNLSEHVVMPGLINAHAHSAMVFFRGLADDLTLMDWLTNHIWPNEKRLVDEHFVYDGTLLAMLEMIRNGITCFNEHYFFPEGTCKAVNHAGMRAIAGAFAIDFASPYAANTDEYIAQGEQLYHRWKDHPLIRIAAAPHSPYAVGDETLLRIKEFADKYNLNIHIHVHEPIEEMEQSQKLYGIRPLKRLHNLGLLTSRTECVHMVQIDDEDIKLLQQTKASVVHCPQSNLKLATGFCQVKRLQDAGINVALGTDGTASNNDLDIFSEMHTAALLAKAVAKDPTAVNAKQALSMATINGARALGIDKEVGSLEVGKSADVIAIRLSDINTTPLYNPFSHLVYCVNSQQVTDVWVAGKRLLKDSKFTTLNEKEIVKKAQEWSQKVTS